MNAKKMQKSDAQWRKSLTPQQYSVLREKTNEAPFSGKLLFNQSKGIYACAACGAALFDSSTKFDSHSGWPSFTMPSQVQWPCIEIIHMA